jgi:hypothetical protein
MLQSPYTFQVRPYFMLVGFRVVRNNSRNRSIIIPHTISYMSVSPYFRLSLIYLAHHSTYRRCRLEPLGVCPEWHHTPVSILQSRIFQAYDRLVHYNALALRVRKGRETDKRSGAASMSDKNHGSFAMFDGDWIVRFLISYQIAKYPIFDMQNQSYLSLVLTKDWDQCWLSGCGQTHNRK